MICLFHYNVIWNGEIKIDQTLACLTLYREITLKKNGCRYCLHAKKRQKLTYSGWLALVWSFPGRLPFWTPVLISYFALSYFWEIIGPLVASFSLDFKSLSVSTVFTCLHFYFLEFLWYFHWMLLLFAVKPFVHSCCEGWYINKLLLASKSTDTKWGRKESELEQMGAKDCTKVKKVEWACLNITVNVKIYLGAWRDILERLEIRTIKDRGIQGRKTEVKGKATKERSRREKQVFEKRCLSWARAQRFQSR